MTHTTTKMAVHYPTYPTFPTPQHKPKTMFPPIQRLSLYTLLFLLVGTTDAFHQPSSRSWGMLSPTVRIAAREGRLVPGIDILLHGGKEETGTSVTALDVIKKKKVSPEIAEPGQVKERVSGIGLFFLYMTPWKNPNSIFVYMLVTLYFLGKYSEAHSVAASNGL
jgi:hypothetical protein